jgi:transposase-like protein
MDEWLPKSEGGAKDFWQNVQNYEEVAMMRFPITDLLDEQSCHDALTRILHPQGLRCPHGHELPEGQCPHMCDRAPVLDYRCRTCGSVFNLFTGTTWAGTHYSCSKIMLILRGFAQGIPTRHLADELECDYGTLLGYRHEMQAAALQRQDTSPLPDAVTEADEAFQNAGEKGKPHLDPEDPPRRRANQRKGKGTMENDRPPIQGVVGRESGQIRLTVCEDTRQATIQPEVEAKTVTETVINTDESSAYFGVAASGRGHGTVCHSRNEYARDDDGDGFCEVHCNTMEGIWTGLRNFLRPFRGVHKKYLSQYVTMFQWAHNLKKVSDYFLRVLMLPRIIYLPT